MGGIKCPFGFFLCVEYIKKETRLYMNRDWTSLTALIVQGLETGGKYSPESRRKIPSPGKFWARL